MKHYQILKETLLYGITDRDLITFSPIRVYSSKESSLEEAYRYSAEFPGSVSGRAVQSLGTGKHMKGFTQQLQCMRLQIWSGTLISFLSLSLSYIFFLFPRGQLDSSRISLSSHVGLGTNPNLWLTLGPCVCVCP
jgi:hypothetical protein